MFEMPGHDVAEVIAIVDGKKGRVRPPASLGAGVDRVVYAVMSHDSRPKLCLFHFNGVDISNK